MLDHPVTTPARDRRRLIGWAVGVLDLVFLLFVLAGTVNPWHLVGLIRWFGDPVLGVIGVLVLTLIAFWLAFPVRSSAVDRGRARVRTLLLVLSLFGLLAAGLDIDQGWYRFRPTPLGQQPGTNHVLARVAVAGGDEIHMFAGSGFFARDLGNFGTPCGLGAQLRFAGPGLLTVDTEYGTYQLRFDERTGAPIDHVPHKCTV